MSGETSTVEDDNIYSKKSKKEERKKRKKDMKKHDEKLEKKKKKKKEKKKKRKQELANEDSPSVSSSLNLPKKRLRSEIVQTDTKKDSISAKSARITNISSGSLPFDHKYILAPMVGASELAFRLLCRKYGTHLAYTPMMSSSDFARDEQYRKAEFQHIPEDRPLVCHFSANNPDEFAQAARLCQDQCDAIDLNLGCPQRTAYLGHFGSYLLGQDDRELVLSIVRAGVKAVSIPIFVKIRLLNTLEETIELCKQLRDAGASLIAIHARYRASFERKGAGARDGPAMLDQVLEIKKVVTEIPIISNGNIITYEDVVDNLKSTKADGVMSAEGILDNPALYLPQLGDNDDSAKSRMVSIADPSSLSNVKCDKKTRKLQKKLREIEKIEKKAKLDGDESLNNDQKEKLATKQDSLRRLAEIEKNEPKVQEGSGEPATKLASLADLYKTAEDPLAMALEYISLVRQYPVKIRSVIFHTRRILKDELKQYQSMEECVACQSVDEVEKLIKKMKNYRANPDMFVYDREKAKREKEALENKRREEGKRKAFEARMIRKAKREGKKDLEHYLRIGAEIPTVVIIKTLKALERDQQMERWKKDHSQHCMSHHLDPEGCKRDRACAFLHVSATGTTTFVESDEVAG